MDICEEKVYSSCLGRRVSVFLLKRILSMKIYMLGLLAISFVLTSCHCKEDRPVGKKGWLRGSMLKKVDTIATHLRGNDVVMWEVRRRHVELYKAVQKKNHLYGLYQLKKIVLAMKMGSARRPKRKPSYDWFFSNGVPPMKKALSEKGDLNKAFRVFTSMCVACHAREKVSFIPVAEPWKPQ